MKEEYDFNKARKNPYAGKMKKQITINITKMPSMISKSSLQ